VLRPSDFSDGLLADNVEGLQDPPPNFSLCLYLIDPLYSPHSPWSFLAGRGGPKIGLHNPPPFFHILPPPLCPPIYPKDPFLDSGGRGQGPSPIFKAPLLSPFDSVRSCRYGSRPHPVVPLLFLSITFSPFLFPPHCRIRPLSWFPFENPPIGTINFFTAESLSD